MKKEALFLISLFACLSTYAQFGGTQQSRDSIRKITGQDYKQMLDQLHITSVRQDANGNDPNAPNAANYDESKKYSKSKMDRPIIKYSPHRSEKPTNMFLYK